MVQNMVHGTYTETYDLNTAIGELSLMAIHTPQAPAVKRMFKGFFQNYSKFKVLGCNFNMVCASQQALDPSQIGLEAGQVDPRDVLNPILFKACTGETVNNLIDQIYQGGLNDADPNSHYYRSVSQFVTSDNTCKSIYYQMLADDSWRKSHPQKGLTVMGLKPFVHKVVTTQPFKWTGYNDPVPSSVANPDNSIPTASNSTVNSFGGAVTKVSATSGSGAVLTSNPSIFVSNGVTDMPWLETAVDAGIGITYNSGSGSSTATVPGKKTITSIPRVYMGAIVLPPAILQRLFFRLQITWHILFKEFRPAWEVGPWNLPGSVSNSLNEEPIPQGDASGELPDKNTTYFNIYHNAIPSSKVTNEFSSFTTTPETEVTLLNEKVQ